MLHLGDITKINGFTAPIVEVVVGGSPCQDLSVAGKRAGLDGERSGLFMEQLRVIKEMREHDRQNGRTDEHIRPRYMVWENVPGAFSSNKAEDFRIVLEETAKVKDENAIIPKPPKNKWTTSGCIVGDGWSIAWRVCDAQFYGVPQRRRRIALVADFGGESASEILFIRKSLSRDSEQSESQRKDTTTDASRGIGADDREPILLESNQNHATIQTNGICTTLPASMGMGGGYVPMITDVIAVDIYNTTLTGNKVCSLTQGYTSTGTCPKVLQTVVAGFCPEPGAKAQGIGYEEGKSPTLRSGNGYVPALVHPIYSVENHPADSRVDIDESGKVQTLTSRMGTGGGNVPMVMALDRSAYNQGKNAKFNIGADENGVVIATNYLDVEMEVEVRKYPVDCERLCNCLREHKAALNLNNKDIAEALDVPLTKVEHWFRNDKYFAIPDPDVWFDLKMLLGISTDEFDKSIMTFETKGGKYDMKNRIHTGNKAPTLARSSGNDLYMLPKETKYIVRRLTPLECERLQGFPDGWTDIGEWTDSKGKVHKTSDSARYKALGNSIALPPWKWVLKRLSACYERDATLGSLFDGIGGFPLIWEQLNGKGSCLWASEIDEFPIAVTKKRIGG